MGRRGMFFLFEGVDRSGKTTQAKMLVDALNASGQPTKFMRFPNRSTAIGKTIDTYLTDPSSALDDRAIHLLFSANRWEAAAELRETLNSGTHVVVDRYAPSGIAFSAAKNLPGMSLQWCKSPDVGLPAPDTVVFMDIPVTEAIKRAEYGTERYEKQEFQEKVRSMFHELKTQEWTMIDATKSIADLHQDIKDLAFDCSSKVEMMPIKNIEA